MAAADFWKDQEAAQKVLQRRKRIEADLDLLRRLRRQEDDTRVLLEWLEAGGDPGNQLPSSLAASESMNEAAGVPKMLGGAHDRANAILSINPWAGGTECPA